MEPGQGPARGTPERAIASPRGPVWVAPGAVEKARVIGRGATVGLLVVLAALIALAVAVATTTRSSAASVDQASRLNNAYQDAHYLIIREEAVSRRYRLEPSTDVLARHEAAAEALDQALAQVNALGVPEDQAFIAALGPQLARYREAAARARATSAAGDLGAANAIDATDVQPILKQVQQSIDAQATDHKDAVQGQLDGLGSSTDLVLAGTLVISVVGLLLVGVFWHVLTGYHRRLHDTLAIVTEQSRHDPLTGVLNQGAIGQTFVRLVERKARDQRCVSMVIVDVNEMKALNDTFGHLMGDAVLHTVARAMQIEGAEVGRSGGDEFIAVLDGADRARAEAYGRRLKDELAGADLRDPDTGAAVPIRVSVGIAVYPEDAGRIEELTGLADAAMYADKRRHTRIGSEGVRGTRTGRDRAARVVGELIPLLAEGETLNAKLNLVASHVARAAGFAGINFNVFDEGIRFQEQDTTLAVGLVTDAPEDAVSEWFTANRGVVNHPVRVVIERTRRPVILTDLSTDPRITEEERRVLLSAGLHCGITVPVIWQSRVIGSLSAARKETASIDLPDSEFLVEVARHVAAVIWTERLVAHLQVATEQLASARDETVLMLAASVEAHDAATGSHLARVRGLTEALALELGDDEESAQRLGMAAVLHDVGKVRVPDTILRGSGALTEEEWIVMKQHTVWGAEFLAARPGFDLAASVARAHHERWDGSGYPAGLAGDAIPEAATIVAVADAFDAMTNDRPYRPGRTVTEAVGEIFACSGRQFSPRVVGALLRLYRARRLGGFGPADVGDTDDVELAA